jgi:prepilin-type N-terminal cleavage/methylation domain-containing protein
VCLTKRSRSAFTLIEVMVAAILISVVGLSLLQMHTNSAQMSHTMQMKFRYADWILMAAFEGEIEERKKQLSFETLMKPFSIDSDPIRKGLDKKAEISSALVARIDAGDMAKEIEEQSNLEIPVFEGLRLEIYAQKIQMEHESYLVYRVLKR